MEIKVNRLNPNVFLELYTSAGWDPPCVEQVTTALQHSFATFLAVEGDKPVGMVRLLGDGGMSFYLKDFVVIPEMRGHGIGRALEEAAEHYIRTHISLDWAVSLELISSIEAQPFYEKLEFESRPCDWDGPGMMKILR